MTAPRVHLDRISRDFPQPDGKQTVLHRQSLSAQPGERLLIFGPSGCGKTTLLHIIALLDLPDQGTLSLDGDATIDWTEDTRAAYRAQHIGMVTQHFHLLPHHNLIDNLLLATRYHAHPEALDPMEVLENVGLASHAHKPARLLSGGEKQRLCIARSLIQRPRLLLADEPTGNLDPENAARIRDLFEKLTGPDTTVIVASHDPLWKRFASRAFQAAETHDFQEVTP